MGRGRGEKKGVCKVKREEVRREGVTGREREGEGK
jgi:hypothetical protein